MTRSRNPFTRSGWAASRRPSGRTKRTTASRHNVTITRLYKDGDEWKTSTSFGREELPLVAKIADMAHTWIYQQGQESNGDSQHSNGDSR